MYTGSEKSTQPTLFFEEEFRFRGKAKKTFTDPLCWHNVFHREVVCNVEEKLFLPLFSKGIGAPNSPIRILIGMMVIKEGFGLSDEKLFEDCHFNLLYKRALGLLNTDDSIPVASTYYKFRKQVADYSERTGENLFDACFSKITNLQAIEYKVSGKRIRMDSKLMGSNIAWLSRYELIHETLRMFLLKHVASQNISEEEKERLSEVLKFEGNKIVYQHTSEEVKSRLQALGIIIGKLLEGYQMAKGKEIDNLRRVFAEQYQIEKDSKVVIPRDKKEITADSLQSPHDSEAVYRKKGEQQKKGFAINVTESCGDDNGLDLIADVQVAKANASDSSFLQKGVERSSEVFGERAKFAHADGAYNNQSNQEYCGSNDLTLYLHAIQGASGRYAYRFNELGELIVTDTETGIEQQATAIISRKGEKKWKFIITEGKKRYITQKDIDTYELRKRIENTPIEELQKRNNVEATIFQLGYHYPHAKSRYRGLIKHQMWANMRCLWVNCVRITNYKVKQALSACYFSILTILKPLLDPFESFVFAVFTQKTHLTQYLTK